MGGWVGRGGGGAPLPAYPRSVASSSREAVIGIECPLACFVHGFGEVEGPSLYCAAPVAARAMPRNVRNLSGNGRPARTKRWQSFSVALLVLLNRPHRRVARVSWGARAKTVAAVASSTVECCF